MPIPSALDIEGTLFPIKEGDQAFAIIEEPAIVQQADIAGASRASKSTRPDLLQWRWDDWAGGEGQTWVDSSNDASFTKYSTTDLAIDVSTPGQVQLGLVLTAEFTGSAMTQTLGGPFLATHAEKPWVVYDNVAQERTGASTWTSRTTNVASGGGLTAHQPRAAGPFLYIPYRGTTGIIRINTGTAGAVFNATLSEGLWSLDGRLYSVRPQNAGTTTAKTDFNRAPISTGTNTLVGSVDSYSDENGVCAIGHDIYWLLHEAGQTPVIYKDGGSPETVTLYGQLPLGFRVYDLEDNSLVAQNGCLFAGGFFPGTTNQAVLWYSIPGGSSGIIGRIRPGTSMKVNALFADQRNGVLIGTDNGMIFRYDMATGGLSQFASAQASATITDNITSIDYASGLYYFSARTSGLVPKVYSNVGATYPDATIITGSKWDFNFPEEEKLLMSVTVQASIPTGCTVKYSFKADDGSTVTTDASGAAMSMTTSGTQTFTISNAGTERTFRWLQPLLELDTNTGGGKTLTPTVYSVTHKCTTTGKQKFLRATVDLRDMDASYRTMGRQVSGALLGQTLETLVENSSNRIITVKPYFEKSMHPHVRTSDSYTCVIHQAQIEYNTPGQGKATLLLRIVP